MALMPGGVVDDVIHVGVQRLSSAQEGDVESAGVADTQLQVEVFVG